ncbi:hypothetical protein Ancab_034185 [Ancistrocladus abbreviatus]
MQKFDGKGSKYSIRPGGIQESSKTFTRVETKLGILGPPLEAPGTQGGKGTILQGLSIGDSYIENWNRIILRDLNQVSAEEVWALGKKLGISYEGDEGEVLQCLQAMEAHDNSTMR